MNAANPQSTPPKSTKSGLVLAVGLVIGVAGIILGVYGMRGASRNGDIASNANCLPAAARAKELDGLAKGEVAAVKVPLTPHAITDLSFLKPDGTTVKLSNFRGKVVLFNLWATWCPPCRQEMPALDRVQASLGGADFEVVAVNIDTQRLEKPKQFLQDIKVGHLAYYSDPTAATFADLKRVGKAFGMPTTLLIDRQGCEIGNLAGAADWASEDALALLKLAIAR